MKILYAIQATGNGHIIRAKETIPHLLDRGLELDIFLSGSLSEIDLGYPIKHRSKGLSFKYNKNGGISKLATFKGLNILRTFKEINEFPINEYDFVLNDFEPISAWAAKIRGTPSISWSHQAALTSPRSPKPKEIDILGEMILSNYAPCGYNIGFHYQKYDFNIEENFIRKDFERFEVMQKNHITVYLPSFEEEKLLEIFKNEKNYEYHIFTKRDSNKLNQKNIKFLKIENDTFLKDLCESSGVICNTGFETTSEVLNLGKKLLTIPIKGQYEQDCNAAALKRLGVYTSKKLNSEILEDWFFSKAIHKKMNGDVNISIQKVLNYFNL